MRLSAHEALSKSSWRWCCLLQGGWPLKVPFNPNYSMILGVYDYSCPEGRDDKQLRCLKLFNAWNIHCLYLVQTSKMINNSTMVWVLLIPIRFIHQNAEHVLISEHFWYKYEEGCTQSKGSGSQAWLTSGEVRKLHHPVPKAHNGTVDTSNRQQVYCISPNNLVHLTIPIASNK